MLRNIFLILCLLLISLSIPAIEVTPTTQPDDAKINAIQSQQAIILQRVVSIESRLNEIPVKPEVEKQFYQMAGFTRQEVSTSNNILIIALVLSQLFQLGLAGGFYLYFKMNRRL